MSVLGKVARRNLAAHKVRLALTLVSVLLGTAFVAGSFVFTDTLRHSFDNIFNVADKGIDTRVEPQHSYDPGAPFAVADRIRALPGAAVVEPLASGNVVLINQHGVKVDSGGAPSVGSNWTPRSETITPGLVTLTGHAPNAPGQVAINSDAATKAGLAIGDHAKVVTVNAGTVPVTVVGVYTIPTQTGGYIGVQFSQAQAIRLFTDGAHWSSIEVKAAPGVSEQALTARVATVVPAGLKVQTGTQARDEDTADVASALSFVNYLLLGFGIVALLVGTFIIYNTFTMLIAQRQRELALLRAIGAGRNQVRRSVVSEAALIGLLGSVLGIAGGIGLAFGLKALLDSFNLGLPSGGLVLSPRTVIVTVVLGTVVTVLAAYAPARRAGRIPPVAAMREEFASTSAASLRRRTAAGVVAGVLGIGATVVAVTSGSAGTSASMTGLALVAMCAAAMLCAPVLSRWIIVPLGRLVGAPFGTVGQLARTNAVRNPRRTAATAFALTLGLVLVAGIAVIGSSVKASLGKVVDDTVTADYIVGTNNAIGLPSTTAAAVERVPGVGSTTTLNELEASLGGHRQSGIGVDGPLSSTVNLGLVAGKLDATGHNLMVSQPNAQKYGWHVGDTVTLRAVRAAGVAPVVEHIVGIYPVNQLVGPFVASGEVYRALTPPDLRSTFGIAAILVNGKPGANLDQLRTGLDQATNKYYVVYVQDKNEFKGQIANQVNGLIGLLYGLLGLAIVIAVLGIINTLALSVVERRREIGMLRAIGMQRGQVRRTIYLESLLIAVFGAVLGLVLGLAYGSLFTRALDAAGLDQLSVPWGQAVLFLVLAGIVGVLAALWPGIRAARTRPLSAIAES